MRSLSIQDHTLSVSKLTLHKLMSVGLVVCFIVQRAMLLQAGPGIQLYC